MNIPLETMFMLKGLYCEIQHVFLYPKKYKLYDSIQRYSSKKVSVHCTLVCGQAANVGMYTFGEEVGEGCLFYHATFTL